MSALITASERGTHLGFPIGFLNGSIVMQRVTTGAGGGRIKDWRKELA
jgi:hypothetical protein